jgi:ribosomal protein S27E
MFKRYFKEKRSIVIRSCYVSHTCPQCGGEVVFDQEATGTRCRYCGAGLVVLGGRSAWLNFLIKPKIRVQDTVGAVAKIAQKNEWRPPLVRSVIPFYYPFYRTRGHALKWIRGEKRSEDKPVADIVEEVRARSYDIMRPAHEDLSCGLFSPGYRVQTLHLHLATRENAGKWCYLEGQLDREEFLEKTRGSSAEGLEIPGVMVTDDMAFQLWERHSIVYFPFSLVEIREGKQIRQLLLDAVGGSLVRQIGHQEMETLLDNMGQSGAKSPGEGRLKRLPLICPECAGDLDPSVTAVVRFCGSCGRGWESDGSRLKERECLWSGTEVILRSPGTVFLPFWRRSDAERSCVIPAFGVRAPGSLYSISRRYFEARFPAEPIPYDSRLRIEAVDAQIPAEEADEMIHVLSETSDKKAFKTRSGHQSLILIPFMRRGPDLVDHYHGLAVPVGALENRL